MTEASGITARDIKVGDVITGVDGMRLVVTKVEPRNGGVYVEVVPERAAP